MRSLESRGQESLEERTWDLQSTETMAVGETAEREEEGREKKGMEIEAEGRNLGNAFLSQPRRSQFGTLRKTIPCDGTTGQRVCRHHSRRKGVSAGSDALEGES